MFRNWIFLIFISTIVSFPLVVAAEKTVKFGPYSLRIPGTFAILESDSPAVILLAHQKGLRFPSVNILRIAGQYEFNRSRPELEGAISDSYRQVGLADVHATAAVIERTGSFPLIQASLTYRDGQSQMRSLIAIFQGTDDHYILTLLGPDSTSSQLQLLFDGLIDSTEGPAASPIPSSPTSSFLPYLLFGGIFLCFTLLLLLRCRSSRCRGTG